MAKLSFDDIQKIAALARIELEPTEIEQLTIQLSSILDYVDQLQGTEVKNIEPTSQVTGLVDVWRDDEVKPCALSREQLLANTPMVEDGYIKVRRVL